MITKHKKHNFLNYCQRCDKIIHFYETFPDKKDKIITEDGFMQWLFTLDIISLLLKRGFPGGSDGRILPALQETWVWSWVGKICWRRVWQPIPVFLPGESPWTEEPARLQSFRSQRVRHILATKQRQLKWLLKCAATRSIFWFQNYE